MDKKGGGGVGGRRSAKSPRLSTQGGPSGQKFEKNDDDVAGNPKEEWHTDFYYQPLASEAVCRYFYHLQTASLDHGW